MRLVQVAKILGMTGQELRHELEQVNFGVKPTDREIPDGLAKGIIRFIANKKGLSIDVESLGMEDDDKDGEGKDDARLPPACRTGRAGRSEDRFISIRTGPHI